MTKRRENSLDENRVDSDDGEHDEPLDVSRHSGPVRNSKNSLRTCDRRLQWDQRCRKTKGMKTAPAAFSE